MNLQTVNGSMDANGTPNSLQLDANGAANSLTVGSIESNVDTDSLTVGTIDHNSVNDGLHVVTDGLEGLPGEMNNATANLQISGDGEITCSCSCPAPDEHHHAQSHLLSEASGVLTSDKNVQLSSYSTHQPHETHGHNINIESMAHGTSTIPLDTPQYYNSIHSQPIMVYEVPSANILPFDSLVSVSLGGKNVIRKSTDGLDLLQSAIGVTDGVYSPHNQSISPLYIMPESEKVKNEGQDGMVIGSLHSEESVTQNIVLSNRTHEGYDKTNDHNTDINVPIHSEFNLISSSSYNTNENSVKGMDNLSLSTVYHTSNDTDSEVALTLASLGNPKHDKITESCNVSVTDNSDVIQVASILSSVADRQQLDTYILPVSPPVSTSFIKKEQRSSLVLRSRRSRGTAPNSHYNDFTMGDPEKIGKRKKRKEPKPNKENSNLLTKPVPSTLSQTQSSTHSTMQLSSQPTTQLPTTQPTTLSTTQHTNQLNVQKENLLGQLLKASEQCEPASLIPEGVVDDVIPAVGYRIMDMSNLSEMIRMMHHCAGSMGSVVIQEQASLREGAVSQLSVICTGCQEGAVCATSNRVYDDDRVWDINARVQQLTKEFNIKEDQVQRMLEILGIFYRPSDPIFLPIPAQPTVPVNEVDQITNKKKRKRKKTDVEHVEKQKNLVCSVCKEKFAGENHLKKHMQSHDLALHTCPYCHAYFKKPFNLKEHVKKHENHKFDCSHCDHSFTDRSSLKCHIRSQHERRYHIQCEECPKQFYHRTHYKEHMRLHTKEKPYFCELCGKSFSWHDSVKKHMQTHNAEPKYRCRLCGKMFRWLQGVRQHLQQQHRLKKGDIEAQVVTATTLPVSNVTYNQEQHNLTTIHDTQQQQQPQQQHDKHHQPHPQENNQDNIKYNSLDSVAGTHSTGVAQGSLPMFTVSESRTKQEDIFQY